MIQHSTDVTRAPVVAGRFYPADRAALEREAKGYLASTKTAPAGRARLVMVPHAGYFYSGRVAGETIAAADLADSILLLGPNHTGQGRPLALWAEGAWRTPLGLVAVDAPLAAAILAGTPEITADQTAHRQEHSLEVVLPFLQIARPGARIVPLAVAEPRLDRLTAVAASLARTLADRDVSLVVSSDMSHYLPDDETRRLDSQALQAILALDPTGLYEVVRRQGISMCGVLPMTLALLVAKALGAAQAELVAYATSGDASGDVSRVVGYAGVVAV